MSATSSLTKGEKRKLQAAGSAAREDGKPVSFCPEPTFSEKEYHWQIGWWRHFYAEASAAEVATQLGKDSKEAR